MTFHNFANKNQKFVGKTRKTSHWEILRSVFQKKWTHMEFERKFSQKLAPCCEQIAYFRIFNLLFSNFQRGRCEYIYKYSQYL